MEDVSPALFMSAMWGYQTTAAMKAAIALDFFTAIGDGAQTPVALAEKTGSAERGVRILADFLTIRGFLEKHDGTYRLTASTAAFLNRHSAMYMGSTIDCA